MNMHDKRWAIGLLIAVAIIKITLVIWSETQFDFKTYTSDTPISIWDRWDSLAYKTIATQWYTPTGLQQDYFQFLSHFPPMYPILIRLFSLSLFLPIRESALLVSWIAILFATYYLYKLVLLETLDRKQAILAGFLLNIYPVSYFTIAPYTESLFLLLAIVTFYLLKKYPNKKFISAIVASMAILTRLLGIALLPAFAWILWKKFRSRTLTLTDALFIILPVAAVQLYLLLNLRYYGQPLFFLHEYAINPYSAKTTMIPYQETWQTIIIIMKNAWRGAWDSNLANTTGINSLFTAFALLVSAYGILKKKIAIQYSLYSITYITLFASFHWGVSNARYSLAVFPIFMILAQIKSKIILVLLSIIFIALLLHFTKIYTSGWWAF